MKLLILGGTIFLGRHLAQAALEAGHEVTLFHRGEHGADLFPEAETLLGDRDGGLMMLRGRQWDAVVDTSAYFPAWVRDSARLLAKAAGHYTFVSSISVYADFSSPGVRENTPVARLSEEQLQRAEQLRQSGPVRAAQLGDLYGGLKALCEEEAEGAFPGRTLVVRPGLIVGPHDYSDRFTYWVERVAAGGEVLAPGAPEAPVQFIDARDLAEWMLRMAEARTAGVYHATGPARPLGMQAFLNDCRAAAGSDARFTWASDEFLTQQKVGPWVELPLWIPNTPDSVGFARVDCSKAIASGLKLRPVPETVRDTLAWARTRPAGEERKAGLAREREKELLAALA